MVDQLSEPWILAAVQVLLLARVGLAGDHVLQLRSQYDELVDFLELHVLGAVELRLPEGYLLP